MDAFSGPGRTSTELTNAPIAPPSEHAVEDDPAEGSSTPVRIHRDDFEDVPSEVGTARPKKDYAVREVDFYYGVRGPALSSGTRKLKTGPADPTGTVSSARGWFKNILGGKTKEKHKGFEVVRSARAPPPGLFPPTADTDGRPSEPYRDDPTSPVAARQDRVRSLQTTYPQAQRESIHDDEPVSDGSDDEDVDAYQKLPTRPPSLPLIDSVGAIELPSRIGSEASRKSRKRGPPPQESVPPVPPVPRRSSRRSSSKDLDLPSGAKSRLPTVQGSPSAQRHSSGAPGMMPFAHESPSKNNRYSVGAESATSEFHDDNQENMPPATYTQHLRQSSSALGSHVAAARPSSMGFVQQHRASDNIHYSPDSPEFEGSTAEVYGTSARQ